MAIQVSTIQVRGKIGNAVGYKRSGARRSGANFARVYTDVVRDPQTASQLYQRAIAATVSKAYAAMSRICDHSFQAAAVGAESMQRFYSVNLNQLRRDVMADLSDPVTDPVDMVGCVVAPRSAFPTCYPFIVSEGTLTNSFLRVSSIDAQLCILFPAALSAAETVSAYVRRYGLVRGDIFTALGLGVLDPEGAFSSQYGQLASQPSTSFGFIRFKLKDAAFSDNSPVADAPVSQVFAVEYGGRATAFADDELPERAVFCDSITGGDDGFIGVIRSRRNSPLRSSCRLQGTLTDGTVSEESKYGIKSAYLLNAWLPEQDTLGQSSLILEGGGFPEQAPALASDFYAASSSNGAPLLLLLGGVQYLVKGKSIGNFNYRYVVCNNEEFTVQGNLTGDVDRDFMFTELQNSVPAGYEDYPIAEVDLTASTGPGAPVVRVDVIAQIGQQQQIFQLPATNVLVGTQDSFFTNNDEEGISVSVIS